MMDKAWGIRYLMVHGNLRVPASRYGRDTAECAEIAWVAAEAIADATGEPVHERDLDYAMYLVVNDHDDIENLIPNYADLS